MIVLGLTGSIGMGKSTTAGFFREAGAAVHDADAAVHALYENEAVGPVGDAFPGAVHKGRVDRQALGAIVLNDPGAMATLESIVHPLVQMREKAFLARARAAGVPLVVLDIPLLLEKGGDKRVDAVVVVSADRETQRARVLARPNMSGEKFAAVLARQTPDAEKRRRAHFVIDTGRGFDAARRQVAGIMRALAGR